MRLKALVVGLLALLLPSVQGGCEKTEAPPERHPPAGFLEQEGNRRAGRELFMAHCASCHGTADEGRLATANRYRPPPPHFTSPRYRTADPGHLYWRICRGKQVEPYRSRGSVMPAWCPHFSEEQIWQLVAYLRSRPGG